MDLTKEFSKPQHLSIKVEVDPGTSINDAFIEAINIATKLDCLVKFSFNGVECGAFPNGNYQWGIKEFDSVASLDIRYKYAYARVKP